MSATVGIVPAEAAPPSVPIPGPTGSPSPIPVPGPSGGSLQRAEAPCTIDGDDGPNRLTGTPGPDVICGNGGDDIVEGLEGDDVLDGGEGNDTATWETAACCVRADLATGSATGLMGNDSLVAVEHLIGSQGADVLWGTGDPNMLSGLAATDLLYGGDGDDTLFGGDGDDWLAGEGGANALDGGAGANVCAEGGGVACAPTSPPDRDDSRGPLDVALVITALNQDPTLWRIQFRRRSSASRLWDDGFALVSFDSQGGDGFDIHAVVRWTKRSARGLLIGEGHRNPSGRLSAKRGGRGVLLRVPLGRLGLEPGRAYYRWAAETIYTGGRCRPCFDLAPEAGAYPQPVG
jgi:hypothetical protein